MRRSKNSRCFFLVLLAAGALLLAGCVPGEPEPEPNTRPDHDEPKATDQALLETASRHLDVPLDALETLSTRKATYRWTEQTVTAVKLLDARDDRGFDLVVDDFGKVLDGRELARANQDAFTSRYGNLEPELYEMVQVQQEEPVKVGIWLKTEPRRAVASNRSRGDEDPEKLQAVRARLLEDTRTANRATVQRFETALKGADIPVKYASSVAPVVFLEGSPEQIRSAAKLEGAEFVYLARVGEDLNNSAIPSVAGSAWPTTQFEGSEVRIAIVEDDGIDFANPHLVAASPGSHLPDNNNQGHPTQTAGVAASRHTVYRGMAPQALLISANGNSYDADKIIAATDWAIDTANADVVNCSFGFGSSDARHDVMARYYDHVVWNDWRAVTPAAGNNAGSVLSPGVAYNVVTVGGINDADTPWHGDDTIYSSTSWQDPPSTHNDREKPEVSAVAVGLLTTEASDYPQWITAPGSGHNGTSYAAPAVAGAIARLIDRKGFLRVWPEETKAILMASAVRAVSDATVDTDNSGVDVKEGVGTVVVPLAEKVVSQDWHHGQYINSGSFPVNHYFEAEEDDVVRFAIAWNAHTDSSYSAVMLEGDLDLHVYDPSGTRVAYSVSWDNPYEIVEFTAPETGTYRAYVRDWRFDGSYEWLGLAWSRR